MELFAKRMEPVTVEMYRRREAVRNQGVKNDIRANRAYLKSMREGDYLIRVNRSNVRNYLGEDKMYVDYTYTQPDGWFVLSSRKNAQWFTGAEAQEWIRKYKGFTICKR